MRSCAYANGEHWIPVVSADFIIAALTHRGTTGSCGSWRDRSRLWMTYKKARNEGTRAKKRGRPHALLMLVGDPPPSGIDLVPNPAVHAVEEQSDSG